LSARSLGFKAKLTDQQVAGLADRMRAAWAVESTFKPEGVASIRHGK
jgi:hypothetical protein